MPITALQKRIRHVLTTYRLSSMLFVLFLHGLAALVCGQLDLQKQPRPGWSFQVLALIVVSAGLVPVLASMRNRRILPLVIALQGFVLLVAGYPYQSAGPACVFVCVMALELAAWFEIKLWLLLLTQSVFGLLLWLRPFPVLDRFDTIAVSLGFADLGIVALVAWAAALFCWRQRRYVDRLEYANRHTQHLNESVENLLTANLDFQNYAVEAGARSTIEERKRLSREIHDIVGYSLVNLKMMTESAIDLAGKNKKLLKLLGEARDEIQNGLAESRRAMHLFHDREENLVAGIQAIQKLVDAFSHATGVEVVANYGNIATKLGAELDAVCYRIVQESITNAFRHGHATRILVYFWLHNGILLLSIDDNGKGSDAIHPGIGLRGMRERIEPFNGTLKVRSSDYGFSVRVEIPVNAVRG